ncbi:COL6A [Mytilus edulis]|uniref:COL6A n=1 Tax=Mytilus edulis TaxID=6550 RepID=A0A8S3UXN0_MYTED|nr:COL6A [Mytilus edulis]
MFLVKGISEEVDIINVPRTFLIRRSIIHRILLSLLLSGYKCANENTTTHLSGSSSTAHPHNSVGTTTIEPITKKIPINSTTAPPLNHTNGHQHNRTNKINGCVNDPADIIFLLDRSKSVGAANYRHGLNFIKDFAKHYKIGPQNVQIGVVSFSGSATEEINMKQYAKIHDLNTAIDNITYPSQHDGTHTSTALQYIRENGFTNKSGDRPHVPNFLVVITDGISRPAEFYPDKEAAKLHQTNIETFVIGIGNIDPSELRLIGTDDKHVYTVKDHLDLHIPLRHIRCAPTTLETTTKPPITTTTTKVTTTKTTVQTTTSSSISTPTTTQSTTPTTTQTTTPTTAPRTTQTLTTQTTTPTPTTQTTTQTTPATTQTTLSTTKAKGLVECMGCKRIAEPHDCEKVITCAEHEVCDAISKYGKRDTVQKRQDGNLYVCQECCNTEHCNRFGCIDKAKLNRTVCFNCVDVSKPSDCDVIEICDVDKKCFARHYITDMFVERWRLGCEDRRKCTDIAKYSMYAGHPKTKKQVIGGSDGFDLCYYCCDDNFCNKKECEKGILSTAVQKDEHNTVIYID